MLDAVYGIFVLELFLYKKKHNKNQFIVRQTQIIQVRNRTQSIRSKKKISNIDLVVKRLYIGKAVDERYILSFIFIK